MTRHQSGGTLLHQLSERYRLESRTWAARTPRTPQYAGCYNNPQSWWEGAVGPHVVTFWGELPATSFTGEVMVGAFTAWRLAWLDRRDGLGDLLHYPDIRLLPELRLPAVQEAMPRLSPAVHRLGLSHLGLNAKLVDAAAPALFADVELFARIASALVDRPEPPLHAAIEAGNVTHVRELLASGADPNDRGKTLARCADGSDYTPTPLILAVQHGQVEIVRLLLAHGADYRRDAYIHDAHILLNLVVQERHIGALRALFEAGMSLEQPVTLTRLATAPTGTPLLLAALAGWLEGVEMLLDAGANPEAGVGFWRTARRLASGPQEHEIERVIDAAIERRSRAGRLSLANGGTGGELGLAARPTPEKEGS